MYRLLLSVIFSVSVFTNTFANNATGKSPFPVLNISPLPSYSPNQSIATRWQSLLNYNILENNTAVNSPVSESSASFSLQAKYSNLLNIDASMLPGEQMLESIDYWYGTRYRYGGTSKRGIDCSAFVREIYRSVYSMELPRTAREQYYAANRISMTELKEGDLVFFNTRGGISHVGMYLRNNKFVHSSSSRGVAISDLYEPYYISHLIGAARIKKIEN